MQRGALPSLDLLMPFEAAARHGSFTRAARELNVTQSAVSQRVRTLEQQLGVQLFERGNRSIALTAEGRALLIGTSVALRHLKAATRSLYRAASRTPVRMGADTSITEFWLMPRLQAQMAADPDLAIELTVSDTEVDMLATDLALLHGAGDWPGFAATPLFGDEVFPVCTPGFRERYGIERVEDLRQVPLIELDYIHWNWMNWAIWMTTVGCEAGGHDIRFKCNSYVQTMEMARSGLGVALAWRHLEGEQLSSGALIRPVPAVARNSFGYYLLLRDGASPATHALRDALLTSLAGG